METLKDIFQSLIDGYKERTKSPLIGSFMISFFFFNWKYFAVLFYSSWPIHCRIEWIEENYKILINFCIPLFIALCYVLILPYLNLIFEYCLRYYTNSKIKKNNNSKIDKLKHKVIEAREQRNIADAKAGTSELNDLNERNEALIQENTSLIEQNRNDLIRHNSIVDQFKEREVEYNERIENLTFELNIAKERINYYKITDKYPKELEVVIDADKKLSPNQKIEFYRHFTNVEKGLDSTLNDELLRKFTSLRLAAPGYGGDKQLMLTNFGDAFIEHLTEKSYDIF